MGCAGRHQAALDIHHLNGFLEGLRHRWVVLALDHHSKGAQPQYSLGTRVLGIAHEILNITQHNTARERVSHGIKLFFFGKQLFNARHTPNLLVLGLNFAFERIDLGLEFGGRLPLQEGKAAGPNEE